MAHPTSYLGTRIKPAESKTSATATMMTAFFRLRFDAAVSLTSLRAGGSMASFVLSVCIAVNTFRRLRYFTAVLMDAFRIRTLRST